MSRPATLPELQAHCGERFRWLLLGAAITCLLVFLAWPRSLAAQGGAPLMNLALFGYRPFAMGSIVAFIYGTALFGSTYLLPVDMQRAGRLQ